MTVEHHVIKILDRQTGKTSYLKGFKESSDEGISYSLVSKPSQACIFATGMCAQKASYALQGLKFVGYELVPYNHAVAYVGK